MDGVDVMDSELQDRLRQGHGEGGLGRGAGPPERWLPKWQIGVDMYRSGDASLTLAGAYTQERVHGKSLYVIVEGVGSGSAVLEGRGGRPRSMGLGLPLEACSL